MATEKKKKHFGNFIQTVITIMKVFRSGWVGLIQRQVMIKWHLRKYNEKKVLLLIFF